MFDEWTTVFLNQSKKVEIGPSFSYQATKILSYVRFRRSPKPANALYVAP